MNKVFDGNGIQSCKISMEMVLLVRNKLGLSDGFIKEPSHEDPTYRSWECANDMIIS